MKDTGGAAFPLAIPPIGDYGLGMTLRDYFAAAALQGLLANPDMLIETGEVLESGGPEPPDHMAHWSYMHADAMLKERAK
jgi:hypothetical protein